LSNHKSQKVVNDNQVIALEDLNVSGMLNNRKLSRAISQPGWREFRTLCEAKSEKFGRELVVINRWEPTSQICSDCGYRWGKLDLKLREIICLSCGTVHDRDDNASKIIEQVGVGHKSFFSTSLSINSHYSGYSFQTDLSPTSLTCSCRIKEISVL